MNLSRCTVTWTSSLKTTMSIRFLFHSVNVDQILLLLLLLLLLSLLLLQFCVFIVEI